jgi:hypothetical protein
MNNIERNKINLRKNSITICLNEISWNIVRNDCENWVETSYALIINENILYKDELYIICDEWGTDSTNLEVSRDQIKLILDKLNKRYKLWENLSKGGSLLWKPEDIWFEKIVIICGIEFGRLTPEAIKYIKEEYFNIPVHIL